MRTPTLDDRLNQAAKPYRFSIGRWELQQLAQRLRVPYARARAAVSEMSDTSRVMQYMDLLNEIRLVEFDRESAEIETGVRSQPALQSRIEALRQERETLRPAVQSILTTQIRTVLQREGIYNPFDRYARLRVTFPPISFVLGEPPHVLIVSPRERIERLREVMLTQQLDLSATEAIEQGVDGLDVSSMVTNLGGFGGTYPAFVSDEGSLQWTVATATEEWLHQYLAFKPLGFRYVLDLVGIKKDPQIATMNETFVGILSKEIGRKVMEEFYPQYTAPQAPSRPTDPAVDFHKEMRITRLRVDELLAAGQVEQAEQYMEERRLFLASKGYYIRRLNQAYFAFYGSYADMPSSVDPIGQEMREARSRCASLQQFLRDISCMTSHDDLLRYLAPEPYDWRAVQAEPGI